MPQGQRFHERHFRVPPFPHSPSPTGHSRVSDILRQRLEALATALIQRAFWQCPHSRLVHFPGSDTSAVVDSSGAMLMSMIHRRRYIGDALPIQRQKRHLPIKQGEKENPRRIIHSIHAHAKEKTRDGNLRHRNTQPQDMHSPHKERKYFGRDGMSTFQHNNEAQIASSRTNMAITSPNRQQTLVLCCATGTMPDGTTLFKFAVCDGNCSGRQ